MAEFYTSVVCSGSTVLYRGYDDLGRRVQERRRGYSPSLFVPTQKKTKYSDIHGRTLDRIQPGSISECHDFVEKYKGVDGFEILGNNNYAVQYISDAFPGTVEWNYDLLKIAVLDIETETEQGFATIENPTERINVISFKMSGKTYIFCLGKAIFTDKNITCISYDHEEEMLEAFLEFWNTPSITPDIVTGWNIRFFDIPYIVARTTRLLGEDAAKKLSPWKYIRSKSIEKWGTSYPVYDLSGISVLDLYELYKKYHPTNEESYKLDYISEKVLGDKKTDYTEYSSFKEFYTNNFQKFVEYNVQDIELVERLEKKLNLIKLHLSVAYQAKVLPEAVFAQTQTWEAIIYNFLKEKNVVPPLKTHHTKDAQFAGAFVKEPKIGMHKWIVSFDATSLYPSIIMQANISPDTIVPIESIPEVPSYDAVTVDSLISKSVNLDFLKNRNLSFTANRQVFRRDIRGFMGEVIEKLFARRKAAKKISLDLLKSAEVEKDVSKKAKILSEQVKYSIEEKALKILLNSLYGATGTPYFLFYDIRIAEAVTKTGQVAIQTFAKAVNDYLNAVLKTNNEDFVIASDTDSLYIGLAPLVDRVYKDQTDIKKIVSFLSKVCEDISKKVLTPASEALCNYLHSYENRLLMKSEAISDVSIFLGKKRYILNVYSNEGVVYDKPKIKILGIETTRSSTPKVCREQLKKMIEKILNTDEKTVQEEIEKFRTKFNAMTPEEIAFPRSVQNMAKWSSKDSIYSSGTPIAVKGALLYNHFVKKMRLLEERIVDGSKVKFLYLKTPNPIGNNSVAFLNKIPKEFGLQPFIDYHTQFEKAFLDPLRSLVECIGWKTEKVATLDSLFC